MDSPADLRPHFSFTRRGIELELLASTTRLAQSFGYVPSTVTSSVADATSDNMQWPV